MDLSKLTNPRGVSTGSDTTRLVVLTVLALIVVFAFIYFKFQSHQDAEQTPIRPEDYIEAPEVNRQPGASVDPEKLVAVRDGEIAERVIKEKEPYLHLIRQAGRLVYGDMELLGVKKAVAGEIIKDPAAYRGKPLEIKGNLQWFEKITDLEFELYRGYITSYEGDYYYFTLLDMPRGIKVGDVVKIQGFFFKLYSFTLPGEDARINDAVFLIGKRLIPSFYEMPPVYALDTNLLDTLYDYDVEDMTKPFDEKPLYHLLSFVYNLSEEGADAMAYEELLPIEILKAPDMYRGAPVKVLGEVVWLDWRNLGPEGENPVGPKKLYHGVLCNYRGYFAYFLAFDIPDWIKVQSKDLVYAEGFFFRNYAYRTRNENIQPAPVVIVKRFEKFILPEDNTLRYISFAILGGAGLMIMIFFFHVFRDRKQNRRFREKFIEQKKRQLSRIMDQEAGPKSVPDTDPEQQEPPSDAPAPGDEATRGD